MAEQKFNNKLVNKKKFIRIWQKKLNNKFYESELYETSKIIDNFLLEKIKKDNILEIDGLGIFLFIRKFIKNKFKNMIFYQPNKKLLNNLNIYYYYINKKHQFLNKKFLLKK